MTDSPNIIAQMQAALARIPKGGRMTIKLAPWCRPFAEAIRARGEEVTVEALAKEMGWPLPTSDRTASKPSSGRTSAPPPTA